MPVKRRTTTITAEGDGYSPSNQSKSICDKSELQLFEPVTEQGCIVESITEEIHPIAPLSNGGPISFDIPSCEEFYTDMYHSYFKVKLKVTKAAKAIDPAFDKVAPVNSLLTAIFSRVSLTVQGVKVGSDTTLHPFIAYITQLLSYSANAKTTNLENQTIWIKDSGSDPSSKNFTENLSLISRRKYVQKEAELYGKLSLDLANQPRLIPNRTAMGIVLDRSADEFALISETEEDYSIEITDCAFFVRRVKLNPFVASSIESRIASQPAQFPFIRIDARSFTIPTGTSQWKARNIFSGLLPRRVIYGVLPQPAFAGDYSKNPFVFGKNSFILTLARTKHVVCNTKIHIRWLNVVAGNHGIKHVNFCADSKSLLLKPLEPDFEKNRYMECYWSLLQAMRKQASGEPLDVGFTEYKNQSCLFAHDLEPDPGSPSKNGCFSIETRFKKATSETLTGLVIAEFKSCMMLNRDRNVFCFDY